MNAVQCDGCGRFNVTDPPDRYRPVPQNVIIPGDWFRVYVESGTPMTSGFEWQVCSLPCIVNVAGRLAERGELP